MSFMDTADKANRAATTLGFLDMAEKATIADRVVQSDLTRYGTRAKYLGAVDEAGHGLPGSKALGLAGGALSALGLYNDIDTMVDRGVTGDGIASASGNAAGVASSVLGATPLGAAMGSYAFGTTTGQVGNEYARDKGFLGERNADYGPAGNRGWDDMAADWGRATRDKIGGIPGYGLGLLATLGGSVVGTGGAAGSAIASTGERAGRWLLDLDNPLLAGVGDQIAAANTNR